MARAAGGVGAEQQEVRVGNVPAAPAAKLGDSCLLLWEGNQGNTWTSQKGTQIQYYTNVVLPDGTPLSVHHKANLCRMTLKFRSKPSCTMQRRPGTPKESSRTAARRGGRGTAATYLSHRLIDLLQLLRWHGVQIHGGGVCAEYAQQTELVFIRSFTNSIERQFLPNNEDNGGLGWCFQITGAQ
jgi:hypothetical protein